MGHSMAGANAIGRSGGPLVARANDVRIAHRSHFASQLAIDLDIETPPVRAQTTDFTWTLFSDLALLRFASKACSLKYAAKAFRDFYLLKVHAKVNASILTLRETILVHLKSATHVFRLLRIVNRKKPSLVWILRRSALLQVFTRYIH